MRLADHPVRSAAGQRMLVVGDAVLPLYDAASALGHSAPTTASSPSSCRARSAASRWPSRALIGQRELVTRPLPADLAELAPVSGAAVLSDGEIALLVDCDALMTDTLAPAPRAPPERTRTTTMPNARYTDLQLDALRELANIGSGTAGTALSSLLGCPIELSVPSASGLELADAVEAAGAPEDVVWGVVVPVSGQVDATALLVIADADAATICTHARRRGRHRHRALGAGRDRQHHGQLLRRRAGHDDRLRARPAPAASRRATCWAPSSPASWPRTATTHELALVLDSELEVAGEACTLSFMLLPTPAGVAELLHRIGLGD